MSYIIIKPRNINYFPLSYANKEYTYKLTEGIKSFQTVFPLFYINPIEGNIGECRLVDQHIYICFYYYYFHYKIYVQYCKICYKGESTAKFEPYLTVGMQKYNDIREALNNITFSNSLWYLPSMNFFTNPNSITNMDLTLLVKEPKKKKNAVQTQCKRTDVNIRHVVHVLIIHVFRMVKAFYLMKKWTYNVGLGMEHINSLKMNLYRSDKYASNN